MNFPNLMDQIYSFKVANCDMVRVTDDKYAILVYNMKTDSFL